MRAVLERIADHGTIPQGALQSRWSLVAAGEDHGADGFGTHELAGSSRPRGAHADDPGDGEGAAQRSSGPWSSRQPPLWGGVPPVPRTRSAPAITTATLRAAMARRNKVM